MNWVERLTPENTEEIRPNLFIKKTKFGYRQVYPAAWNGKIIWKNVIIGPNFVKNFSIFIIILGLAWAYHSDTAQLTEFYAEHANPDRFCMNYYNGNYGSGDDFKIEVTDEGETNTIRSYFSKITG